MSEDDHKTSKPRSGGLPAETKRAPAAATRRAPDSSDKDQPREGGGQAEAASRVGSPGAGSRADFPELGGSRYRLIKRIGGGGFGTVYEAWDEHFDLAVAIKVIDDADLDELDRVEFRKSFDREAKTARRLEHPGIVRVNDYDPKVPFIAMTLVEAGTLQDELRRRSVLTEAEVIDLGVDVADALDFAHGNGVVAHRDIKPANIFCLGDGRFQVGDFGIVRVPQEPGSKTTKSIMAGAGTANYMAPEQIGTPRTVDRRADVFSLGVVLYEALTGDKPYRTVTLDFDPETHPESARKILDAAFEPPVPIRKLAPNTSRQLERVVMRALDPDPGRRYQTCGKFCDALRELRGGSGRPNAKGIAAALGFVFVGIALVALISSGALRVGPLSRGGPGASTPVAGSVLAPTVSEPTAVDHRGRAGSDGGQASTLMKSVPMAEDAAGTPTPTQVTATATVIATVPTLPTAPAASAIDALEPTVGTANVVNTPRPTARATHAVNTRRPTVAKRPEPKPRVFTATPTQEDRCVADPFAVGCSAALPEVRRTVSKRVR